MIILILCLYRVALWVGSSRFSVTLTRALATASHLRHPHLVPIPLSPQLQFISHSDYTSSSSSYRSSIYSRIRTLFNVPHDRDDFSVFRRSSSGKILTTFHPQSSEDTNVESSSEETSVQSEVPRTYRRISFRTIRNAFRNSLPRNSASTFRSIRSSIQERGNRSSTYSSIQDTSYLDADETSISTVSDSVLIPPGQK